jgi:hypothetical protein
LRDKEGLQRAIYYERRHGRFGHNTHSLQARTAQVLVLGSLRSLRRDTIFKHEYDTVKQAQFQTILRRR